MTEDRLIHVETKIAYLEASVDELSRVVLKQEEALRDLRKLTAHLADKLKAQGESLTDDLPKEERPPHY